MEFLSTELHTDRTEGRNKRNSLLKEKSPGKKKAADELIEQLEQELREGKSVIEEQPEDESPSNARTPAPPPADGLLIQRKFTKMIDDDTQSIPDIIYEKEEDEPMFMDFLQERQRSNSLGHMSSCQTKDMLDKLLLEDQTPFTPKYSAHLIENATPQSNMEAGFG